MQQLLLLLLVVGWTGHVVCSGGSDKTRRTTGCEGVDGGKRITNVCFDDRGMYIFGRNSSEFGVVKQTGKTVGYWYNYECNKGLQIAGKMCTSCLPVATARLEFQPEIAAGTTFREELVLVVNLWPKEVIQFGHHLSKLVYALQWMSVVTRKPKRVVLIADDDMWDEYGEHSSVLFYVYMQLILRIAPSLKFEKKQLCFKEVYMNNMEEHIGYTEKSVGAWRRMVKEDYGVDLVVSVKRDGRRVLILQRGKNSSTSVRRFENIDEIVGKLKVDGWEVRVRVLQPWEPLSGTIDIISWANVIIGSHGSHMKNIVFARPGTLVIEMWKDDVEILPGTGVYGIKYVWSVGHTCSGGGEPKKGWSGVHCNLIIDYKKLKSVLVVE